MELFATADLLFVQNRFDESILTLDSIETDYPGHALADESLFLKYRIAMKQRDYKLSEKHLQQIIDTYSYDILADNAIYYLAELNQHKFDNNDKAMELYQRLLTDYPGSLFVVEARKRFRTLRGDEIN